jgi:hypothetical protein
MKKAFLILATVLITVCVFAQAPQKMSYQAVIRNANNQLINNQQVGIRFSILSGSITGTAVYVEKQTLTTNYSGIISAEIGGGSIVSGSFSSIDWESGPYYIKTETDPLGGSNYTIAGTSQLLSVPYALHAKNAESITRGGSSGFIHYIGELFGGGIVVSVWKVNGAEHGLIASLTDISSSSSWSNITEEFIGATAQSPKDGQVNTTAIIKQTGHSSSAAKLCDEYTSGTYIDWYLPSVFELSQCYNAVLIANEVLGDINGFQLEEYWSSTEVSESKESFPRAYGFRFDRGETSDPNSKSNTLRVRAARRF